MIMTPATRSDVFRELKGLQRAEGASERELKGLQRAEGVSES